MITARNDKGPGGIRSLDAMHVSDEQPGDAVSLATAEQRRLRIGLLLDGIIGQQDKLLRLVAEAKDNKDYVALGFPSWPAYVTQEFGGRLAQLNPADRRSAVLALTETGMSTRAIAPIVGVDHSTVQRDLVHVAPPARPEGIDPGDPRAVEVAVTGAMKFLADNPMPTKTIIGTDGKSYARTERTQSTSPKRRPLPDTARDLAHDIRKVTLRVDRVAADERLARNRDAVAGRLRADLERTIVAAQLLVDLLSQEEADS